MKRTKSATIHLSLRMKERLRAQLERAAKMNGTSINTETVNRVEQSFEIESRFGGSQNVDLINMIGNMMKIAETRYGSDWRENKKAHAWFLNGQAAILYIFSKAESTRPLVRVDLDLDAAMKFADSMTGEQK